MTEPTTSGSQLPPASATKAELVDYAEQNGISRAEAEGLTKDDLRTRLEQQGPKPAADPLQSGPGQVYADNSGDTSNRTDDAEQ